jgi:signal transduction histidine kinase
MVLSRLERFVKAIGRVSEGDLDEQVVDEHADEIGELARSFNQMTEGLRGKVALEQSLQGQTEQLQAQTNRLSTLNVIAATVSQSLNLKQILDSALDKVLELLHLQAGWIVLQNPQTEELTMAAAHGLPEEVALAHVRCAWDQGACAQVLDIGRARIFRGEMEPLCPTAAYFAQEGLIFRACIPVTSKDRVLGVMSLVGHTSNRPESLGDDTLEMLEAIGLQIGVAVENARLYEELRREEVLRRGLLERVMTVQEEEHRRISLELHDQTGQSLTSLIIKLSSLAEAKSLTEVHAHLQELRDAVAQILHEVHDLALELRPSVLDDLGLLAALRHLRKGYEDSIHIPVDLEALGFENERLSPEVETALFRIVQEALTNVAKHAQARSISVLLEHVGSSVKLIVEDDGVGFDVARVTTSSPSEKLGLYGMRERALALGGTLTVESTPGMGTAIFVEIPLSEGDRSHGQDPPAGG